MPRITRKTLFLICTALLVVTLAPSVGLLVDLVLEGKGSDGSSTAGPERGWPRRILSILAGLGAGSPTGTSAQVANQGAVLPSELQTAAGMWEFFAAAKATGDTIAFSSLPKIALMFLTRGPMPFEATWQVFLEGMNSSQPGSLTWSDFYAVHVHAPPNFTYSEGSWFANSLIEDRLDVEWGQYSIMQAERNLMKAALADPAVQRFVMLSESCIPLYAAHVVWAQLLSSPLSRINACYNDSDPGQSNAVMTYRWHRDMETDNLKLRHWRKSGQWVALTRRHVQLVVDDQEVNDKFKQHCLVDVENWKKGWKVRWFCVADEHYLPTFLASRGLDNETDCRGATTHAWWDGPYSHPRTHQAKDANQDFLRILRGNQDPSPRCDTDRVIQSAMNVFQRGTAAPQLADQDLNAVAVAGLLQAEDAAQMNASELANATVVNISQPISDANTPALHGKQRILPRDKLARAGQDRNVTLAVLAERQHKRRARKASRVLRRMGGAKYHAQHRAASSESRRQLLGSHQSYAEDNVGGSHEKWHSAAYRALQQDSVLDARATAAGGEKAASALTVEHVTQVLLHDFEGMKDPGCALFARKFDHAAADAILHLASQYIPDGNRTQKGLLRHLLDASSHDEHMQSRIHDLLLSQLAWDASIAGMP